LNKQNQRASNEIRHGQLLAAQGAEGIWGWGSPAGKKRAERRAKLIAAGADLKVGQNVLEVGCGTGLFTEIFAETGASIVAVDISPDLLEIAQSRDLPRGQVKFLEKRFEDCDLEGPFDAIIGSSILHHLDIDSALGNIQRLLKPDGVMCFAEPNMLNPQIMIQKNIPWIKARLGDSPDETAFFRWQITRKLKAHGFETVNVYPFDWLHPSTPQTLISLVSRIGKTLEQLPLVREISGSLVIQARRPQQAALA
jgi:2-polyprenyl-3-methyl-5-hydroxy-6-metoxy-1,4-benzoquinol methylase